jgi:hypothetical protein
VVPWVLLAPVVAMAASWPLLGEVPGPAELAGAALLVIGVLTAQGIIRRPAAAHKDQTHHNQLPERTLPSAATADRAGNRADPTAGRGLPDADPMPEPVST